MAQRTKGELIENHPHVDLCGSRSIVHLPALIDRLHEEDHVIATEFGDFGAGRNWSARRIDGINAWIPIMRGCNYNCTYCIVPKTRGREKSRDPDLIEAEVREAVANGYVQITLLGQTVDAYGKTLGDGTTLASLLRRLDAVEGLKRLRFVTSHPKDITDDLLITARMQACLHAPARPSTSRRIACSSPDGASVYARGLSQPGRTSPSPVP